MDRGVVAVDIGGTAVKAGYVTVNEPTIVQGRSEHDTGTGQAEPSMAAIITAIREVESAAMKDGVTISGYGITAPGPTDPMRNYVTKPQLGWHEFPFGDRLRSAVNASNVVIQNDANAAAFGCWYHDGKWDESLLLITVSTGVGAGLVLPGGRILDGATGNGAEIGHVPFGEYECEFAHGVGCIEGSVAGSGIKNRFGIEPRDADREIRGVVAHDLGTALCGVVALYDPNRIVFMGSVAYGYQEADEAEGLSPGECFIGIVQRRIAECTVNKRNIEINLSPFGDDTGILGGAALALHEKH